MAVFEESDLFSPKEGEKNKVISFSSGFIYLSNLDIRMICAIELHKWGRERESFISILWVDIWKSSAFSPSYGIKIMENACRTNRFCFP